MASTAILNKKEDIVKEISEKVKNSESVLLFTYQGLTVSDMNDLRSALKDADGDVKIYKNTLVKRALDNLNISLADEFLEGPNAIVFGKNLLEPIKALSKFVKDHEVAQIRVGIISGDVADIDTIKKYAAIPSRDTLLTQLAAGMMSYVKDLSIALNLYSETLGGSEDKKEDVKEVDDKEVNTKEDSKEETQEAEAEAEVKEETPAEETAEETAEEAQEEPQEN